MEEILASIRRIIADEEPADSAAHAGAAFDAPPPRTAPSPPEPAAREEEIDSMLARLQGEPRQAPLPEQPVASERTAEPMPAARGGRFEESAPEQHAARPPEERRGVPPAGDRGLVSAATTAAVDAAFNALAQSTLAQAAQARNGRTLEELVSELIRPMLKTWLDENLPGMVERLVRAEIERVSRGRGE
jgi:cell pole-organizing protein PopZ